ncbi:tRNA pseudouridine(55) synthase TruB [uncultured Desulfuromusa sp.]|uniref:tRNA pseudouridine(55) synthase TruB n=1 Tax=uncultured Desulfuromusa sp. TaxID=219183 RepID=UPI002AA923E0|nr:tRNA pseudouridine(55) synthase TruB [uncultured Desulfuromusa sp.]
MTNSSVNILHGLLLIDKAAGMTSHDVVRKVRRIFQTRKVGHGGTLDPLATGVLPVAIGDGTKILQFLLAEDKSYRATFKLGITTDTLDVDGQILLERSVPEFSLTDLEDICSEFRGDIKQLPPMFSALKKNGVPLYKLARQGQTVERQHRDVTIQRLAIINCEAEEITIEVDCSKGTYIRSLISDIGERLGCGACLTDLRRTKSGDFSINECQTLENLQQLDDLSSILLSLDEALRSCPAVLLNETAAAALKFGIPPQRNQTQVDTEIVNGDLVRLQVDHKLAAMARYAPLRNKEKRGDYELIRVFGSH